METRPLGQTGLSISLIGLGGGGLPNDDKTSAEVSHAFLKGGVNFVDTSPNYCGGESERRLGAALADVPRESYVLQTKMGDEGAAYADVQNGGFSPFSRDGVLASVRRSLELLRTKHIDTLLLHDPYADELDAFLSKGGGMEAVRELKSSGIVKHFGCGAREHEPHLRLLEALGPNEFKVAQTVDDENPLRRFLDQLGLRAKLKENGVGIINAAPLYRGLLVNQPTAYHSVAGGSNGGTHSGVLGEHSGSHVELSTLASSMNEWCAAKSLSLTHLAVQWPIARAGEDVVCSPYGCRNVEQVKGILDAASTPLPEGTWEAFDAEFDEKVKALGPEKHFYWFKKQSADTKEWSEMSVYPRATWGASFV